MDEKQTEKMWLDRLYSFFLVEKLAVRLKSCTFAQNYT